MGSTQQKQFISFKPLPVVGFKETAKVWPAKAPVSARHYRFAREQACSISACQKIADHLFSHPVRLGVLPADVPEVLVISVGAHPRVRPRSTSIWADTHVRPYVGTPPNTNPLHCHEDFALQRPRKDVKGKPSQ